MIAGVDRHAATEARIRNRYIRAAPMGGPAAVLGPLLAAGHRHADLRARSAGRPAAPAEACPGAGSQAELDRRWLLLHMAASEIARLKGLSSGPAELLARAEQLLPGYATRAALSPPRDFDEAGYLAANADVAARVARGEFGSGFDHFVKFGRAEGRQRPAPA